MSHLSIQSRREWLQTTAHATTMGLALTAMGQSLSNLTAAAAAPLEQGDPPQVTVSSVRRVFHNGQHNAFTDLCRYRGQLYLTFRSCPDGHMVHPTASVIVQRSRDGEKWDEVHRFRVEQRDTRDPHFLIFRDRLFVYSGTLV